MEGPLLQVVLGVDVHPQLQQEREGVEAPSSSSNVDRRLAEAATEAPAVHPQMRKPLMQSIDCNIVVRSCCMAEGRASCDAVQAAVELLITSSEGQGKGYVLGQIFIPAFGL